MGERPSTSKTKEQNSKTAKQNTAVRPFILMLLGVGTN